MKRVANEELSMPLKVYKVLFIVREINSQKEIPNSNLDIVITKAKVNSMKHLFQSVRNMTSWGNNKQILAIVFQKIYQLSKWTHTIFQFTQSHT